MPGRAASLREAPDASTGATRPARITGSQIQRAAGIRCAGMVARLCHICPVRRWAQLCTLHLLTSLMPAVTSCELVAPSSSVNCSRFSPNTHDQTIGLLLVAAAGQAARAAPRQRSGISAGVVLALLTGIIIKFKIFDGGRESRSVPGRRLAPERSPAPIAQRLIRRRRCHSDDRRPAPCSPLPASRRR